MNNGYSRPFMDEAVDDAQNVITRHGAQASVQLGDVASTIDDYVHDYPWLAVLTGIVIAGTVGFIAGSAVATKRGPVLPRD